ncbi:hypothetical protein G6M87_32310 (plasmid) [Rhizobium rhizogenes]|uniref:RolB family protein n=1 Tax=Rhizobium rhizogenes TaxID=359 RepID=UPI001571D516|nr:RolB family protein [Rhizobium rhizogenes]NTI26899.1 hypothetical protein [Rhizobium rhizogenes]QTG10230.1 hypothetical protein G6M87_32310 [Rhizobium rhizogenes]
MADLHTLGSQRSQPPANMMGLANADELRSRLFAAFLKRQITKKGLVAKLCESGTAYKRLASGALPEISGSRAVEEVIAFIYVSAETLQLILGSGSLAQAKLPTLIAVNVAPFCTNFSSALLLQAINLLGARRWGRDDVSHFIAIAVSKNASSKTLTMAPPDEGSAESFKGFPLIPEGGAAFEMVAYG